MKPRNIKHLIVDIDSITPHPKNVRQGDIGAISESLKAHGQYRPIVVDERTGQILAGNHTWKAAKALGWSQIQASFIETKDDDEATRILLADNKANDLATYDDDELINLLKQLAETDEGLEGSLFDGDDLDLLLEDQENDEEWNKTENSYSQALKIPQYEIVGELPLTDELTDSTYTNKLLKQINEIDLPDDIKNFLIAGTTRHIVFNYAKIAEFYPHQTTEVQQLMENSALVIIDADDAIANGFASFDRTINQLREQDDFNE